MDSMTGFGRGEAQHGGIRITVELKSVNHRFLDLSIRLPRQLSMLDDCVRAALRESFVRGRIEVSVYVNFSGDACGSVSVDMDMIKSYINAAATVSKATGIKGKLGISELLRLPDAISFEKKEYSADELRPVMLEALSTACGQLKASRSKEGTRLIEDMLMRIGLLSDIVDGIALREPVVIDEYRTKLKVRLEEFLAGSDIDPVRFNQEVLYFADKANVTEETVRLRSHFERLKETFSGNAANGRSLDFIVQELNREFNTIGSKSSDLEITNLVITAKGEVEKIREQVQNIE